MIARSILRDNPEINRQLEAIDSLSGSAHLWYCDKCGIIYDIAETIFEDGGDARYHRIKCPNCGHRRRF